MKKIIIYLFVSLSVSGLFSLSIASSQKNKSYILDASVYHGMQQYHVPVVSLAVIEQGKIIYTRAYSIDKQLKVNSNSIFQSASISKSVAAYGALLLVDQSKIWLDDDVNHYLTTWKIPSSPYTARIKVTLRNILSMTSGLSVPGFAGHSTHDALPTLKQILNGEPPAENKAVRVLFTPGSQYYYSGGSYEVLEQLIADITHTSFSTFITNKIFIPLNMNNSYVTAILPNALWSRTVPGFLKAGNQIPGKWKIIPALGAGGMWTTPADLAKFAINIMNSFNGRNGLISKPLAREMLTRQKNTDFGLGFVIDGNGNNLNFRKEGHNIGFYTWLIAFPNTQQGAIIMTNSENGMPLIKDTLQAISQLYQWPDHYPIVDESERMN